MKVRLSIVALSLALAAVAAAKGMYVGRMTEDELQAKVHAGPEIKQVRAQHPPALPAGTQVEVYFKKLDRASMPSQKAHFSMGEGSAPAWKPTRIASLTLYHFNRSDPIALASFKKIAADIGGTALINVERAPVLLKGSLRPRRNEADWSYDIIGYAYYADVVVKR